MYAYFLPSNLRRLRLWQEEVRGMPLLGVEVPTKLRPRQCRRILRTLAHCGVHETLNRPASWPNENPLPPLIATRSFWLEQAPAVAAALLKQAGISDGQAAILFYAEVFTPEIAALARRMAPGIRALHFSCPVPEDFCWEMQRNFGISPRQGGSCALTIGFAPVRGGLVLPLWCARPEVPRLRLTCPQIEVPTGCPETPLLAALRQQGRLHREEIEIRADFS